MNAPAHDPQLSPLLELLTLDEIEQALRFVQDCKGRFGFLAQELLKTADGLEISPRVAHMTISAECLLLSAFMYFRHVSGGDRAAFLDLAQSAFSMAASHKEGEGQ
jgi:hypothetical protein